MAAGFFMFPLELCGFVTSDFCSRTLIHSSTTNPSALFRSTAILHAKSGKLPQT